VVRVPSYRPRDLGLDSRRYQIFWEVVGLERGPLSLVSTTEALLERKSSSCDLEKWEYGYRDPSRRPRGTLFPQKLALTSPTSGGHSVGIVRSRTKATELLFLNFVVCILLRVLDQVKVQGFRITQHCLNTCLIFYSYIYIYIPLKMVIRPKHVAVTE
jgi:hypothetical protein